LESVQQDAILTCGHLNRHDIRMCEMQRKAEGTGTILTYATRACETKLCYFYEGTCASVVALEKDRRVHEQIIHSGLEPVVWCSIFLGSHGFGGFRAIASRLMTIN
jgi:hypothetical protein